MTSLAGASDHLPNRGQRVDLFAVLDLAAYLDESEVTGATGTFFSVGGTLATVDQWRGFEAGWKPYIDALRKPFHAKDPDCIPLAEPLALLMREHTLVSCNISFPVSIYDHVMTHDVKSRFGSEYSIGVQGVIGVFSDWSQARGLGPIGYFPEQGHENFGRVMKLLNAVNQNDSFKAIMRLETWGPVTKADMPAHCADGVSHYCSRYLAHKPFGQSAFRGLLEAGDMLIEKPLDKTTLEAMAEKLGMLARVERAEKDARRAQRRKERRLQGPRSSSE